MDYDIHILVNAVTNQAAAIQKMLRRMRAYYMFEDHRPGTDIERFDRDAREFMEYRSMFRM